MRVCTQTSYLERSHYAVNVDEQPLTQEEIQVPCHTARGTLSPMLHLKMNPKFFSETREEPQVPRLNSRGGPTPRLLLKRNPCSPLEFKMNTKPPKAPWKDSQDHHCNSRATMRIQLNRRGALFPITRTAPPKKTEELPQQKKRIPSPQQEWGPQDIAPKRSHLATNTDEPTEVSLEEFHKMREEQSREKLVRRLSARSREDAPPHGDNPPTTQEKVSLQLEGSSESRDSTKNGLSMATGEDLLVPLYSSRTPSTLHNSSRTPSPLLQLLKNPELPATIQKDPEPAAVT